MCSYMVNYQVAFEMDRSSIPWNDPRKDVTVKMILYRLCYKM